MIVLNYTELNKLHGVMRSKKKRKEKEHFEQKNGNNKSCLSLLCTFSTTFLFKIKLRNRPSNYTL